jgi:hypothetical protein
LSTATKPLSKRVQEEEEPKGKTEFEVLKSETIGALKTNLEEMQRKGFERIQTHVIGKDNNVFVTEFYKYTPPPKPVEEDDLLGVVKGAHEKKNV